MSMTSGNDPVTLRPATAADLPAINGIYNHYVLHSTCTWQTEASTAEERQAWWAGHGPRHPVIVAEIGGRVVAWGSLSRFHPREAWGGTVEDSVYVHHDFARRGLGRMILGELVRQGGALGHRLIVGVISCDQTASLKLHDAAGFTLAGKLTHAGCKFGKVLDAVYVQYVLQPDSSRPVPAPGH